MGIEELGSRIKDLRILRGYSQSQFAKLCGYTSKTTVSKIESGSQAIPLSKVDKIAAVLGTSKDYLLWGTEPEAKPTLIENTVVPSLQGKKAVLTMWINQMSDEDVDKLLNVIELFFKKEE